MRRRGTSAPSGRTAFPSFGTFSRPGPLLVGTGLNNSVPPRASDLCAGAVLERHGCHGAAWSCAQARWFVHVTSLPLRPRAGLLDFRQKNTYVLKRFFLQNMWCPFFCAQARYLSVLLSERRTRADACEPNVFLSNARSCQSHSLSASHDRKRAAHVCL